LANSSDINHQLEEILIKEENLSSKIKTSSDLEKKMLSNKKEFKKYQDKIFNTYRNEISNYWVKVEKKLRNQLAMETNKKKQLDLAIKVRSEAKELEEEYTEELKRQMKLMGRQVGQQESLFSKIKGFLGGLGLVALGKKIINLVLAPFKEVWEFLDKKVIPAMANLNKTFGNMGSNMSQLRKQTVSTGVQFEILGYSFDEGAEAVTGLAEAMMTVHIPKDNLKTTLMLSEYVQLGAKNAGNLALAFMKSEGNLKNLDDAMKNAIDLTREYGVPVNQIRKDVGENIDILARFGTQNIMTFSKSIAKARSYGLTIKEINSAFGKGMDTFEGTSEAAAKLNAIFGTNINSLELMMETDPTKRMEMLREELVNQGKTWDNLGVFEKNVITSSLKINEQQAQLAFASEKVRKKLQTEEKERMKQVKINKDWEKGLSNIKKTLLAWGPLLDKVLRSVANLIARFFGFESAMEGAYKIANIIEKVMLNLSSGIDNLAKGIDPTKDNIVNLKDVFIDITKTISEFIDGVATAKDFMDTMFSPVLSYRAKKMINQMRIGIFKTDEMKEFAERLNDSHLKQILERKMRMQGYSYEKINQMISRASGQAVAKKLPAEELAETALNPEDIRAKIPKLPGDTPREEVININVSMEGEAVGKAVVRRASK